MDNVQENNGFRYKAFISYRHQAPDQQIAKRLHTLIETYRIPSGIRETSGISSMGKVFRDQEELPLSSSLSEDIHEALEQSEWLICICSPRYLQSKWCLEELNYYIKLGRRDHILTILAEGEPAESFPEQLRFETVNGETVENEPL
ncbi:MAG: toll/interleukin-1 receptor domain-containing protein, partial [Oscillospiraceae bacterium]|nr:toll/interleukin-1 receptor domain-containing protein [Oscillospiraceae bacterium]